MNGHGSETVTTDPGNGRLQIERIDLAHYKIGLHFISTGVSLAQNMFTKNKMHGCFRHEVLLTLEARSSDALAEIATEDDEHDDDR